MRVTEQAHEAVRGAVHAGDIVIDATAGNGHDTLFLARLVGPEGRVIAFDIQEAALAATRVRLAEGKIAEGSVLLLRESHAGLDRHVTGPVGAVMFNLGYLPGSDRTCTTTPGETVRALGAAWKALRAEGILSVVCYRGHPGGADETGAVIRFAQSRKADGASLTISGCEELHGGPCLVVLRKHERP